MKKRITIQDIADDLGLSRNTISKAINGTGNVAPETKNKIFQRAGELGYKQFGFLSAPVPDSPKTVNREIALFTCSVPGSQHLSSTLLDSFQKTMSPLGYRLTVYMLRDDILSACVLPENFNEYSTDAILVTELFDKTYTSFLCNQKTPTLFIDSFANLNHEAIASDVLYMENTNSVYQLISQLLASGCKSVGFIGDRFHCQSFYERWLGYQRAMHEHSPGNYDDFCICENDSDPYQDVEWLAGKINALPRLPDAFFCANDFLAVCTVKALKYLHYTLPDDIKVAGFDDSYESQIIEPPLTTIAIPGTEMGYIATNLLLNRIHYPDTPYSSTYVQTKIIFRASTKNNI